MNSEELTEPEADICPHCEIAELEPGCEMCADCWLGFYSFE